MVTREKKRIGVLYSGGKDSTYACDKLQQENYEISCLITIFSKNKASYMLHTPNIEITELSSSALGIPLITGKTGGEKEAELRDIQRTVLRAKKEYEIDSIGTGAIASQYQRTRIESICSACGLSVASPLWGVDQFEYMRELISSKYSFILTAVSCEGLGKEWLGRIILKEDLEELRRLSQRYKFNVAFEGGEAETLVLDCPLFKSKRIKILESETNWNGYFGSLEIRKAILEDKISS